MDVLGFENILKHLGLGVLRAKYERIVKFVEENSGYGLDIVPTPDGHIAVGGLVIGSAYFSDSVLFWTHYSTMSLPSFTLLIAEAICFGIESDLPLRGAIAVGELILDKESGTFLGEPLVEAARTEREQQWIGVSFGPSFAEPPYNRQFRLFTVLPYKSHYKSVLSPCATGIAVDWPRKWRESRKSDVRPLVRALDRQPEFTEYYARTLAFVDFSERNHDWFIRQPHLAYG
jgi:hypothetical protein